MGRRGEPRATHILQVRLLGMDAEERPILEAARTLNLSRHGVVIEGVNRPMKAGQTVILKFGEKTARYRVVWVGGPGTSRAGRLGLEKLNPADDLWGISLPAPAPDSDLVEPAQEHRAYPRFHASIPVKVTPRGGHPVHSHTSDVSLSGCYVRALSPFKPDTPVATVLWLGDKKLVLKAVVRSTDPGVGFALDFVQLTGDEATRLQRYLEDEPSCRPAHARRRGGVKIPSSRG